MQFTGTGKYHISDELAEIVNMALALLQRLLADEVTVHEFIAAGGLRAALKLVPGVGATISGAVAATGTWALGVAAVRYFIDGVSVEEARKAFSQAAEEGPPSDITRPDED